jgi:hypothetical protein
VDLGLPDDHVEREFLGDVREGCRVACASFQPTMLMVTIQFLRK